MTSYLEKLRRFFNEKQKPRAETTLPQPPAPTETVRPFDEDHNDFAVALYGQLRRPAANLFFSPFSVRMALAMMYAGARGETAVQMSAALRFPANDDDLHAGLSEITARLSKTGRGSREMTVANSLWFQDGAPLRNEFLDLVARHYRGGMNFVDFCSDVEAVRATINRWVEDKTNQKIRELIPAEGLSFDTRLVLVNAVYFKGRWELQFRESATHDEPFYLEGGGKVLAPLMQQTDTVRYVHTGKYQAIELDYRDSDLSMLVLLPEKKKGLRKLEKALSARMLRGCLEKMTECMVEIFLPRFKLTWGTVDIGDRLRALGMPIAFNRDLADFSGVNRCRPPEMDALYISSVFHQALVEVNEEGTEAAAATAVAARPTGMEFSGAPPPVSVFRADHPFLFAIRDRVSGAILFLGRMADPTLES